jgi:hypothetical protein
LKDPEARPLFHRVDGLLFRSWNGLTEADFLAALRASDALQQLGVLPETIEIMADGFGEPEA